MSLKKQLLRVFFGIEICVFSFLYLFGAQGISAIRSLQHDTELLNLEIAGLDKEFKILERELLAWQSNPFYKEKIARERLQMARKGELVFYLS